MQIATDQITEVPRISIRLEPKRSDAYSIFAAHTKEHGRRHRQISGEINARTSPFCRVALVTLILYVMLLVFSYVLNALVSDSCGLGPVRHQLRLKNETTEISGGGLMIGEYPNLDGSSDHVLPGAERIFKKYDKLVIKRTPVGIILNATTGSHNLTNITFLAASKGGLSVAGGAKTNFNVINPDRKRVELPKSFFNSGYYLRNTTELEVGVVDADYYIGDYLSGKCYTLSSHNERSVVPFWLLDFSSLSSSPLDCAEDFQLQIEEYASFHVFYPFIVRDYEGKVRFKDAEFRGELVVQNGNHPLELVLDHSTVNRLMITQQRVTITMDSESSLEVEWPDLGEGGIMTYYGTAGFTIDSSLLNYRANVRVWKNDEFLVNGVELCQGVGRKAEVRCQGGICTCTSM